MISYINPSVPRFRPFNYTIKFPDNIAFLPWPQRQISFFLFVYFNFKFQNSKNY